MLTNRVALGWAVYVLPSVYFFFSFVGNYIQTSAEDVMMSSSANYRPFLSSFRHIPPQEHFVSKLTIQTEHGRL